MYSKDNYYIYNEHNKVQLNKVEGLLKQSYWANERDVKTIQTSIDNSECFSLYCDDEQTLYVRIDVASTEKKNLQIDRAIERSHDHRIFTRV